MSPIDLGDRCQPPIYSTVPARFRIGMAYLVWKCWNSGTAFNYYSNNTNTVNLPLQTKSLLRSDAH